ncbi:MAG: ABC transporter ATP-binding protein [Phycisphaerae bacterium]|nr:ABC transporter ATP-binding protein [Phycisphaerae bacterium]
MILEGKRLSFAYRSDPVLRDVDVRFEPGVTAIIGPNAAGKTTLLRCLCGLLKPRGTVQLDGRDLRRISVAERSRIISYLPQDLSTQIVLSVVEAVLLGRLNGLGWRPGEQDLRVVAGLLDELDLSDLAERTITELSGGQHQMVALAQALAREPHVLLLDEPTANLDIEHQFEICSLMRRLTASREMTTVMALHDLNVAARFADVVYVLQNGAVHSHGPATEVMTNSMIASVYHVNARVTACPDGRPLVTPLELAVFKDARQDRQSRPAE